MPLPRPLADLLQRVKLKLKPLPQAAPGEDPREVFTKIYQDRAWGENEASRSGPGSTLAATRTLRETLPAALEELGVDSLLDAPCGDFHWMQHVDLKVGEYIGGDIVAELIEELRKRFAGAHRRFLVLDVTSDPLPPVDAWLCRDCMIHLPNKMIQSALANFERSRIRYLLATNYPDLTVNVDIRAGAARGINLLRRPFRLPPPLFELEDLTEGGYTRNISVWSRDQVKSR